jgi:hypothetical protein
MASKGSALEEELGEYSEKQAEAALRTFCDAGNRQMHTRRGCTVDERETYEASARSELTRTTLIHTRPVETRVESGVNRDPQAEVVR